MWLDEILAQLAGKPVIGYRPQDPAATEPTAIAALALISHRRHEEARPAVKLIAALQAADGSIGVRQREPAPAWPTSLAVLAWRAFDAEEYRQQIEGGVRWILSAKGKALPQNADMGHDTTLVGWSWAENTHSWIEPTAFHILALKASGQGEHSRTREGVRLLLDRQLPGGGCNYGNTIVMGQALRPHVQSTAIALLALAGEADVGNRIKKSLVWLRRSLSADTPACSLAWGLLGLAAHGIEMPAAPNWLAAAAAHVQAHDQSPHKLALLTLAASNSRILTPDS